MSNFESKVILTKDEYDNLVGSVKDLAEENKALKKDNYIHIVLKNDEMGCFGNYIENTTHVHNVEKIVEDFIKASDNKVHALEFEIKDLNRQLRETKKHARTYEAKLKMERSFFDMTKELNKLTNELLKMKGENENERRK